MTGMKRRLMRIYALLHERFGDLQWWPGDTPFEIIVGAILTQNTAWTNVEKAIDNLKAAQVLSPEQLQVLPIEELAELIRPSGFYNVKAKRLKAFLAHLAREYSLDLDAMFTKDLDLLRPELLSVRGIGKETADSILLYAGGKPTFVIDAYTKRILSRHGLCADDDEYDTLKELFEDSLECDAGLYNEYHAQLVICAKEYCKTKPQCDECPLQLLFEE